MKFTFLMALRSLSFRKFNSILLLIGIILGMIFFMITSVIGDSMNATVLEKQLNNYGEQKMLLTSTEKETLEDIKNNPYFKGYGVIHTAAVCNLENNTQLYIGYADNAALKLGHIGLNEGRMPENIGEIALERSALH
ncbi:MAG: hypothetical protein K0S55_166, partial [Clostridia bacterium]|nr:hypothetical protein [Clostridia bacterium]